MKITLTKTSTIVHLGRDGTEARVWEGVDEHGTRVTAFIALVAVEKTEPPEVHARFLRELREKPAPAAVETWPLRMLIDTDDMPDDEQLGGDHDNEGV